VAEEHIRMVELQRKISSKFRQLNHIANILKICTEDERKALELRMTPVLLCWFSYLGDIQSLKDLV
jgi:ankyrin repeat protein